MKLSIVLMALSLMACPVVATAQVSFGGDEPIDVKAERAAYKGPKTVLSGDVEIVQGSSRINANEMDLLRKQLSEDDQGLVKYGNINLIIAKGKFKYITPQNSVVGDKGVYERDKNIITVTGNVTFTQDSGNTVSGDKLIYDLTTNRARFDSNCEGQTCADDERVNITIGQQ
jgi:lipopolysaccharide export system protein LptA